MTSLIYCFTSASIYRSTFCWIRWVNSVISPYTPFDWTCSRPEPVLEVPSENSLSYKCLQPVGFQNAIHSCSSLGELHLPMNSVGRALVMKAPAMKTLVTKALPFSQSSSSSCTPKLRSPRQLKQLFIQKLLLPSLESSTVSPHWLCLNVPLHCWSLHFFFHWLHCTHVEPRYLRLNSAAKPSTELPVLTGNLLRSL